MNEILWLLILVTTCCTARLLNVTIDDTNGDSTNGKKIDYSDGWQQGNGCDACTAKPSPASSAYMGTWHDTTAQPNGTPSSPTNDTIRTASVSFSGIAVYVSCITTGSVSSPDGNSDMTFFVDEVEEGSFEQSPNNNTSYNFGTVVFSITGLSDGVHSLRLEAGHSGVKSLVLLDAIIYTTNAEDSPTISTTSDSSVSTNQSTSQQGSNARKSALIGAAIGGSIGGVLVIASILGAIVFLRRRRRGKSELGTVIDPYITSEQQVATHIGAGNIGSTSVPKHPKAAPTESSCSSCRDCIYCQVPYTPPPSSDASSTLATVTNRVHTKRMHQPINQSHRESKQKKDQSLPRVDEATSRTQPRPLPIRPSQAGER